MVALGVGQAEHPLLEDRVLAVPQREGQAQPREHVGHARHAVLVPAVGAGPRVVVREVGPGVAVGAVVLADRAPGALAQVRTPQVPRAGGVEALLEVAGVGHPRAFGVERRRVVARRSVGRGHRVVSVGSGAGVVAVARSERGRGQHHHRARTGAVARPSTAGASAPSMDVVGRGERRVDDPPPASPASPHGRQLEVERLPVGVGDHVERDAAAAEREREAARLVGAVGLAQPHAVPVDPGRGAAARRASRRPGGPAAPGRGGAPRSAGSVNRSMPASRSGAVQSNQLSSLSWP